MLPRDSSKRRPAVLKLAPEARKGQLEQAKVDKQLEKVNRTRGKNSGRDVMAGKSQVNVFSALAVAATPPVAAASPARAPAVAATPPATAATPVNPPAARG
eukprot:gene7367-biopygen17176